MSRIRYIFLVILAFFFVDASAQVLIGPTLSGHSGWVSFKDKELKDQYDVKSFYGYSAGASVSFRVRKRFFLQTSLLYTRKGKVVEEKRQEGKPFDGSFSNETKFNYLEMPLLYLVEFKGKLSKKSNREFKWYLGAGPTISYLLGGKGVITDDGLIEADIPSLSYKITFNKDRDDVKAGEMNINDANRIQLSLNLSAGLILEPVGFNKIMVAVRYEFGHSFFSRTQDGYFGGFDGTLFYEDELQVRMRTLNLSLHYFIDLKTDQRNKGKSTIKTKKRQPRRR